MRARSPSASLFSIGIALAIIGCSGAAPKASTEATATDAAATPAAASPPAATKPPVTMLRFARLGWPLPGEVLVPLSPAYPTGIVMAAELGTPVLASAPGVVAFADGDPCCDLGLSVVLDHGDGVETVYGHLGSLEVRAGQRLEQGARLGTSGRTGRVSGPQLHFGVRLRGTYIDPQVLLR